MKAGLTKRVLALVLCVAMMSTDMISVGAEDAPATQTVSGNSSTIEGQQPVEDNAGNLEEPKKQEGADVKAPAADGEEKDDLETKEPVKTVSDGNVIIEDEETPLSETFPAFEAVSDPVDGVVVKVTAEEGVIPVGTTLSVKPAEPIAVEVLEGEISNIVTYKAFDITLLDEDGNEVQPNKEYGDVKVTFSGDVIIPNKNQELNVYHVDVDKENTANSVVTDMAAASDSSVAVEGEEVVMNTTHFSTYIIVISSDKTEVKITIEHYLKDKDGATEENRLFKTSEETVQIGKRLLKEFENETAGNYVVNEGDIKLVNEDKSETSIEDSDLVHDTYYIDVEDDIKVRVYYTPAKKTTYGAVKFYDYFTKSLIMPNGKCTGNINDSANYPIGVKERQKIRVGQSENQTFIQLKNINDKIISSEVSVNNINQNNGGWTQAEWCYLSNRKYPIVTGITTGLDNSGNPIWGTNTRGEQLYDPGLFTDVSKKGKVIYDDEFNLKFSQTGDTYTLYEVVKNEGKTSVSKGKTLAGGGEENRFFPLNDITTLRESGEEVGGNNIYFGMRYEFTFTLGDYVGPLDYQFAGDDDLWVYLDGKLVLDLGGLHSAYPTRYKSDMDNYLKNWPNSVDLWKHIKDADGNYVATKKHKITVLYMERGAWDSNCEMEFTIPNVTASSGTVVEIPKTNVELVKVNKTDTNLPGALFKLENTANNSFSFAESNEDGIVLFEGVAEGSYSLTEDTPPSNYLPSNKVWTVVVESDGNGGLTYTIKDASGKEVPKLNNKYKIVNYSVDDAFERNKTATLLNWEDRTYTIHLDASSLLTETTVGEATGAASTVLVLDKSSSMDDSWSSLQTAAINFVNAAYKSYTDTGVASEIAIVSFGTSSAQDSAFVTVDSEKNRDALVTAITNIDRRQKQLTNTSAGMTSAQTVLKTAKADNNKNVVLFTDGQPYTRWSYTNVSHDIALAAYKTANSIKQNATVHVVGLAIPEDVDIWLDLNGDGKGLKDSKRDPKDSRDNSEHYTCEAYLRLLASDGKYHSAAGASDLSGIFTGIQGETSSTTGVSITGATVTDVLDARFELTEESKEAFDADSSVSYNVDPATGITTITWANAELGVKAGSTPGWYKDFTIVSKKGYIGGNDVSTNGPTSGIVTTNYGSKTFPQPKVNVKIRFEVSDAEDTIFLGENLNGYLSDEKVATITTPTWKNDGTNSTAFDMTGFNSTDVNLVTKWYTDEACTKEISIENLKSQAPEDLKDATKYYAKVTVTPTGTAVTTDNMKGQGNAMSDVSATGTYTVNVVAGFLVITKQIDDKDYAAIQGDPIFTFKITETKSGAVYYKTLRFDNKGTKTLSTKITDLPKGNYQVEELKTMGFSIKEVTNETVSDPAKGVVENNIATFYVGENQADKAISDLTKKNASVKFTNEKKRESGKLTHTDVVKNVFKYENGAWVVTAEEDGDNGETKDYRTNATVTVTQ